MSVTITTQKNIFSGDDSTDSFSYTFPIVDAAEVRLYKKATAANGGGISLIASNYTVTPNAAAAGQVLKVGGSITYPNSGTKLATGEKLIALRATDQDQEISLVTNGIYDALTLMGALDKLTMQIQDLQEQINRCVKYPLDETPATEDVEDFIAAVSAAILNFSVGTYTDLKATAALAPTTKRFGFATDLGEVGALMFYCGNTAYGDTGWFGPIVSQ